MNSLAPISLESRYSKETGTIFITGMQAMLRVMLEQVRADRKAGVRTGGLICGYPGSPLGGIDTELLRNKQIFESEHVFHQLGLNEELAATAIYGTQLIHEVGNAKFDGVIGMWFGKSPGVDRAADALHHANFHGTAKNGGVLVVAGDDPHARSTILPSDSNTIFSSFYNPVLNPGDVQEVLDFGRHGLALSRAAGLWTGFKLISDVADSVGTVEVGPDRVGPLIPEVELDGSILRPTLRPNEAGPAMLEREREIYYGRLEIARQYARLNGLNRIVVNPRSATYGILTTGKTYFEVRTALYNLGLGDEELVASGIRILKMGMVYPFDHETATEFADGLRQVFVIEDKRPFLESQLKNALYGRAGAPEVIGKSDVHGKILLPAYGELSGDAIRAALVEWLSLNTLARAVKRQTSPVRELDRLPESRTPYFCSGCPHNRSLKVPPGSVVGAGIGCHIMTLWMGKVMGDVVSYTQMGGEGAQWVGLRHFTDTQHYFQNLGDGTYAHSGSLAIRFAIAAKANITYKILYNSAVAMTGGQEVFGGGTVQDLVRQLSAEGVKRIVITTDDVNAYKGVVLNPITKVRHRDDLLAVEEELAAVEGVTILINDQQCAAEKRRLRKRGKQKVPQQRVVINERVCEGCGDCGVKSNCLSVEPVDTEYGRKTRINQTSCNRDYSCLLGDCPSFMTIEGEKSTKKKEAIDPGVSFSDPVTCVPTEEFSAVMVGIGGTGVVTVNQILGMAGALAGRKVRALDQTGSSQKAGTVVSYLYLGNEKKDGFPRVLNGTADLFLAFDLLSSCDSANLAAASPERTVLIANSDAVPTGSAVTDVNHHGADNSILREQIKLVTRQNSRILSALTIARNIFGSEVAANMILVGAAYQAGALPLPLNAIEEAVRMNGVAVNENILAFRWGRYAIQDPDGVARIMNSGSGTRSELISVSSQFYEDVSKLRLSESLKQRILLRIDELILYQGVTQAREYVQFLALVRAAECSGGGNYEEITRAVVLNLFKLMAYKDEYEVARLMAYDYDEKLRRGEIHRDQRIYWFLQPTFLRVLGLRRKVRVGRWFIICARALGKMKFLRGSRWDLFGYTRIRRAERAIVQTYRDWLAEALQYLNEENRGVMVEIAGLPDAIRGYEDVKLRNIEVFKQRYSVLLESLLSRKEA